MKVYNKLVRDKIPDIIKESGKHFNISILNDDDYIKSINLKLQEELDEYYNSDSVEELADLVEVVYAILEHKGISIEEFEKIRNGKKHERGGFSKKILLINVDDRDE
ncbi:nucleoside triphosphate pyrophosphohydrolase [Serpentinicella alkaliphila]|uniref:Putative house-cleaning noncanonical NTP pyrophosphatase (MazG superfamily) n=1 Tax=Serpentinicella alkaliphila TaxID=1734049 RepID=A0A4R2TAE0_9FIRM|nr:nucleoside triphosphate pyrophosphohydrolase [Serpentinicella alkaliphila]QUH26036.1 nucleoside triphosphate pyrophosphohydrolase [Serpentinicella alkaliphila]TCP99730.1 putative house-cleaning noncanonical NTP pyrophosphatase (MazG superfamily) [Serpentinicella alkaliphila]